MKKNWVENLTLKERMQVQRFMIKLYSMEINDGKN